MTRTYHLYAGCQAPNGTHDLLILDADHQVVGVVDEALFGVPDRMFRGDGLGSVSYCDGDSVYATNDDSEAAMDTANVVAHMTWDQMRRYVAASPVRSASANVARINLAVNRAVRA